MNPKFATKKFFFRVQMLGWKFIGFWPGNEETPTVLIIFAIFNSFEIFFNAIFQLNYCYLNRYNLVKFLEGITPLMVQILAAIKILVLVSRRKDLKIILDSLFNSFTSS